MLKFDEQAGSTARRYAISRSLTPAGIFFRQFTSAFILLLAFSSGFVFKVAAAPPTGYYLVWGDEFNGSSLDTSKWDYWLLGSRRDAVNVTNGVSLNGSNLVITTYTSGGTHYTAMVANDSTFRSRYGYWEASVKWGDTNGMWSAMWMQSPTMGTYLYDPFVSGSELDIAEHRSTDGGSNGDIINQVQNNIHWNGYGSSAASAGSGNIGSGLGSGFHTYGFLWTPGTAATSIYTVYVDGSNLRSWSYANNAVPISESTEWMIFSSEVDDTSTTWAGTIPTGGYGALGTSTTQLTVDYARYYAPTNTIFWTGASSAYWTNSANWISNLVPTSIKDLTFSYLSANLSPLLGQDYSVDGLVFLNMNNGCTLGGTNTLTLGAGGVDMVAANHSVTISCPVNIGTAQTWLVGPNNPGNTLADSGNLSGSATLSKGSYGTLVLSGTNSFTGTLSAGTGSTTGNDGKLQLASSGAAANAAAITIPNNNSGSSTLQFTGGITVPPPVTLSARNTNVIALENISGSNTLAGSFTITSGGGNYWLQSDAGTLNFAGTISSAGGGTRTLTFLGAGNFYISGVIQNGSASAINLWETNTGTLTLANANTYTGTNRIAAGTLLLANSAALQNATLEMNAADPGALSFGSLTAAMIGGLIGSRNMALANTSSAAVALTTGNNNLNSTYAGVLSGAGSLVKNGSGVFTLTSSNTYAGSTTISGGTLKLTRDPIVKFTFDSVSGFANGSIITNSGTGGGELNGVIVTNAGAGASGASFVAGKVGNALSLAGDGTVVAISNRVTALDGSAAGVNWTLALWLKTTTAGAGYAYQGDGGWTGGNTTFYLNQGNGTAGTRVGAVRYSGGWLTGSASVNDGNWHFIAITDNSGTKNIFVDGNLDATTTGWANASVGSQFWIGGANDPLDGMVDMTGQLDEVSIYNRALSQTEVCSLTNALPALTVGNFGGQLPSTTALAVSAGAAFDLGGSSQTIASLTNGTGGGIITNSGAAPVTLTLGGGSGTNTFSGVIADNAATNAISLVKNGAATEILSGANNFRGPTTINSGSLIVNGALGTNTVTVTGGKLGGGGVIGGAMTVQAGGTLSPGNSTGVLTINNALTLGGTNFIELNKAAQTNDVVRGVSTLHYGGALTVTNLGGTLAIGDSFKIFYATNYSGTFTTLNLPALGVGQAWNTSALTNGILAVGLGAVAPQFSQVSLAGTNLLMSGSGGATGYFYSVLAATNLFTPFTNWSLISTGLFDGNGNFIFSNGINPQSSKQFYEIQIP